MFAELESRLEVLLERVDSEPFKPLGLGADP